jgi:hypothetical protein
VLATAIGQEDKGDTLFLQEGETLRGARNGCGAAEEDAINAVSDVILCISLPFTSWQDLLECEGKVWSLPFVAAIGHAPDAIIEA